MSVKMECPHCQRPLNVTEKAYGKTAPCPACGQPIMVPFPCQSSAPSVDHRLADSNSAQARAVAQSPSSHVLPSIPPMPVGMPPMPDDTIEKPPSGDPLAFLRTEFGNDVSPPRSSGEMLPRPGIMPPRELVSALRHPQEMLYFALAAVIGGLCWLAIAPIVFLFLWVAIPVLVGLWIFQQRYKAEMLGNSVKVSRDQYPGLCEIVERHCGALGLTVPPAVFIVNMNGMVNAIARKVLKDKYVMLYSDLIDLMLAHDSTLELSFIIGHELGHHAAGHTSWWRNALLKPAMLVPFLGGAYSRACELTADRIGAHLCGDNDAACRGLIALACGSKLLSPATNLQMFKNQERELSWFFAFWNDLYSTHPRLTRRALAIEAAAPLLARYRQDVPVGTL
jgi:Zn-dependent protease with chaperone function